MSKPLCKICTQSTRTIYDGQLKTAYYYCGGCGFMFKEEAKMLTPEQEKNRYLAHRNTPGDSGYVAVLKTFIQKSITPFQRNLKTALDFGSGPGPVLAGLLKELGCETDIYDTWFAPGKVYLDKTYDLITCTEVVEHLKDPLAVLKMLKRHLNPGGVLAVMTLFHPVGGASPTPAGLPGEAVFKEWWYRRDPTHISFFRPGTFRFIAGLLGMTILMMDEKNTVSLFYF